MSGKTEVPEGTKFEIRAADAKPAEGEAMTPEEADALLGGADFAEGDELTEETEEGVGPVDSGSEDPEEEEPEPKKAAKIRIGGREFDNQEDAFSYAEELEREKLAADAFRHGIEAAAGSQKGNPEPEVQAEPEENFNEEFFANPQDYMKKRDERIAAKIKADLVREKTQKDTYEETWREFYTDYPDLEGSKDLVNMALQQNWENVKNMDRKPGLKIIADAVRERRKKILQELAPGIELPKTKATASPSGKQGVTQKTQTKKELNFTEQMRQNNAKKRNPAPMKR